MQKIIVRKYLIILFVFTTTTSFGQSLQAAIQSAYQKFISQKEYKYATVSLMVQDISTGNVVFRTNDQIGLAPASTQKVITAATAYQLLGKDFRYETTVGYTGNINDGVLNGNLIIRGSGDPTLGSWRYSSTKEEGVINAIIVAIRQSGIREINGRVLIDESAFDDEVIPNGWVWQDIGNYYGAGATGLNWRENQYDLFLRSGSDLGSVVSIAGTKPSYISGLKLESKLAAAKAGSGDNAYIYLPLFSSTGFVRGTIPVNESKFTISGSMPDPGNQLALTIESILKKQTMKEIEKNYPADTKNSSVATTILTLQSPPLDSICYWFLQKSVNLYGEALLKTLGHKFGKSGSTSEGLKVVNDFWARQGIEKEALRMIDGSGLSPQNRINTDVLVRVLLFARKQSWFDLFYRDLPLYNGMKMKSGSIGGVISYTGFHRSNKGNFVFAVIVNNYSGGGSQTRRKIWEMLDVLK